MTGVTSKKLLLIAAFVKFETDSYPWVCWRIKWYHSLFLSRCLSLFLPYHKQASLISGFCYMCSDFVVQKPVTRKVTGQSLQRSCYLKPGDHHRQLVTPVECCYLVTVTDPLTSADSCLHRWSFVMVTVTVRHGDQSKTGWAAHTAFYAGEVSSWWLSQ